MIVLFPLRCQTRFVRQVVNELKALTSQRQRDELMIRYVGSKFEHAVTFSDDARGVERDLIDFADEVWTRVRGEKRGGAA